MLFVKIIWDKLMLKQTFGFTQHELNLTRNECCIKHKDWLLTSGDFHKGYFIFTCIQCEHEWLRLKGCLNKEEEQLVKDELVERQYIKELKVKPRRIKKELDLPALKRSCERLEKLQKDTPEVLKKRIEELEKELGKSEK